MMKKKINLILGIIIFLIMLFILIYPSIEFYNNGYLYMMSYGKDWDYSEDLKELEQEMCYDESYSYNKKRDISIKGWEYKRFLFFKWFKITYKKGNVCATEYLLEESYIKNFIENAEIIENKDNINLSELIKDREPIVGNIKYLWNDNHSYINYVLDGRNMDMFISTSDEGLLIIQVGLSDEGPKYIAYKSTK